MLEGAHVNPPHDSTEPRSTTIWRHLFDPVDIASLVFFRIAFGILMLWEAWHFFQNDLLRHLFLKPPFLFKFYGFEWVHPWPGNGLYVHFAVLALLSAFIALGLWYRLSVALFGVGFAYVFLLDEGLYLNHFYLICLISLLLIFIPAHRAVSIDAWLCPAIRSETVPAWSLWLLRAQFGIVYFYGGLAKLNTDWLHGEPMRSFLAVQHETPIIGPYVAAPALIYFLTYGGLLFDLLVVPALLWPRTRVIAFTFALFFHLMNAWQFNIDVFPWFMIAATTLFLHPNWPRRIAARWRARARDDTDQQEPDQRVPDLEGSLTRSQRVTLAMLGLYLAVQLVVPLRHFLYPGHSMWTVEGHRFAWRMLLGVKRTEMHFIVETANKDKVWIVDPQRFLSPQQVGVLHPSPALTAQYMQTLVEEWRKNGYDGVSIRRERVPLLFKVTDRSSGKEWTINPVDVGLPPKQANRMSGTPDMVLQFSHYIARQMREEGYEDVEVRADGYLSLHGRVYQRLIDAEVDLAAQPRTLGHASWIMPLEHPFPERTDGW